MFFRVWVRVCDGFGLRFGFWVRVRVWLFKLRCKCFICGGCRLNRKVSLRGWAGYGSRVRLYVLFSSFVGLMIHTSILIHMYILNFISICIFVRTCRKTDANNRTRTFTHACKHTFHAIHSFSGRGQVRHSLAAKPCQRARSRTCPRATRAGFSRAWPTARALQRRRARACVGPPLAASCAQLRGNPNPNPQP